MEEDKGAGLVVAGGAFHCMRGESEFGVGAKIGKKGGGGNEEKLDPEGRGSRPRLPSPTL